MVRKSSIRKILFLCVSILGCTIYSGCMHYSTPMLPKSWKANMCSAKSLEDTPEQPKLHVMVMYHKYSCWHTALRVYCPKKGSLFWDPGGRYATEGRHAGSIRFNDVIIEKVPTVNGYLEWRKRIHTDAVEIFEYNLGDHEAEEFWTILRYGTERSHPKGAFKTSANGGRCGLSVAKFLHRFGEKIAEVDTVFFPHNLAKQLYNTAPDRVIILRQELLYSYEPPSSSGG